MHRLLLAPLTSLALLAPYAYASDPASPELAAATANAPLDPEEQLDEGLKSFGYLTGLALGCVVAEQRVALETEAIDLHAAIARLLGTDRAFLYSSAFGYGTTVKVETRDCKEVIDRYDMRVAKFRASRGGGQ